MSEIQDRIAILRGKIDILTKENEALKAECDRLRDGIEYAQKIGDGRIVVESDSVAVRAIYNHLDDLLAINHKGG